MHAPLHSGLSGITNKNIGTSLLFCYLENIKMVRVSLFLFPVRLNLPRHLPDIDIPFRVRDLDSLRG